MKSFWATAKREIELPHGPVRLLAKSHLRKIIFEYVVVFYNRERDQAILGHLTPTEYYATAKVAQSGIGLCQSNRGNSTSANDCTCLPSFHSNKRELLRTPLL